MTCSIKCVLARESVCVYMRSGLRTLVKQKMDDHLRVRVLRCVYVCSERSRLLTNCSPLLIPDYMTKIVVSNIIRYITHFR